MQFNFTKKVKVQYCMLCKEASDFDRLSDKIKNADRTIEIEGLQDKLRTRRFEVELIKNGGKPILLYSAIEKGRISPEELDKIINIILE